MAEAVLKVCVLTGAFTLTS